MNLTNNTILITGGASGIGLALTERFVNSGNKVIICGRRQATLDEVTSRLPSVIAKACDISVESERVALFEWIAKEHPELNVLVNNAGIQQWMNISDDNFYERAKAEIAINIEAPIHLTSLFANHEPLRTIINVTSGLAFVPLTNVPVYCATKAFFHSFSISSRHLLKEKNIEVIEVIPPALKTDLGGKGLHDFAPPVSEFIESVFAQLASGKTEITLGFSTVMAKADPEVLQVAFQKMNRGLTEL
jgi:uncharacterized oxidoreductase